MQTTYDEMLLLRVLSEKLSLPPIWVLHHSSVAIIREDRFELKEPGGRSRYLEAVANIGCHPLEWETKEELEARAHLLASELQD